MSEEVGASNISVGGGKIDGDNYDMDALRDLSTAEFDQEFPEISKNAKEAAAAEEKKRTSDFDEDNLFDEEDGAPEKAAAPEEEVEEEEESEDEPEPEPAEEEPGKYLTAKSKDGKTYKVAKDALVPVKVNGEIKEMTVQEVINHASGAINVHEENSRLGRERAAFKQEQTKFEETVNTTAENMEMLRDLAENGSPEDFILYYASLTGKNPEEELRRLVENTISYAEQFAGMTTREKELYNENRKFKFGQKLLEKQQAKATQTQTFKEERARVEAALNEDGLEMKDFLAACEVVKQKLQSGELTGQYSPMDIVEYAGHLKHQNLVSGAVSAVDKSRLQDGEFVKGISKAIVTWEALNPGKRFTPDEAQHLVRRALESQKTVTRESLIKKVERHTKSGKTNSQNASSRNQEKNSAGAVTLDEHREKFWGGY